MKGSMAVRLGMAIAGILLAGMALAQGPGGGMSGGRGAGPGFGEHRPPMERAFGAQGEHGRWWNNAKIVERLKLTDAQRKEMDGILLGHREKLVDLRGSVEKAELEMEPLMKEDQPNEGKILAQIDEVAQARAELEKANARFLLAIRSKLTPEQWKQLEADRANRGQERGGWGKDGQGRDDRGPGGQYHREAPLPPLAPLPPPAAPQGAAPPAAGPQSMVDGGPDGSGAPAAGSGDVQ